MTAYWIKTYSIDRAVRCKGDETKSTRFTVVGILDAHVWNGSKLGEILKQVLFGCVPAQAADEQFTIEWEREKGKKDEKVENKETKSTKAEDLVIKTTK